MLDQLDRSQRLTLMKFVCSFAWADLEVHPKERAFLTRMMERLDLDAEERQRVKGWLEVPPAPDSVDPAAIPPKHRAIFIEVIEGIVAADGALALEERENLALLRELLG